jgi:hypothetical protein
LTPGNEAQHDAGPRAAAGAQSDRGRRAADRGGRPLVAAREPLGRAGGCGRLRARGEDRRADLRDHAGGRGARLGPHHRVRPAASSGLHLAPRPSARRPHHRRSDLQPDGRGSHAPRADPPRLAGRRRRPPRRLRPGLAGVVARRLCGLRRGRGRRTAPQSSSQMAPFSRLAWPTRADRGRAAGRRAIDPPEGPGGCRDQGEQEQYLGQRRPARQRAPSWRRARFRRTRPGTPAA